MNKHITPKALVVSVFRTRSQFPHFVHPDSLQLLERLHVSHFHALNFGWWESMIALSTNLRDLELHGSDEVIFQMLWTVSDHCRNLESLTMTRGVHTGNSDYDALTAVMTNCKKLKQLCMFECRPSMPSLLATNIPFCVTTDKYQFDVYASRAKQAIIFNNKYLVWQDVPQSRVETYIQKWSRHVQAPRALTIMHATHCASVMALVHAAQVLCALRSFTLNDCTNLNVDTFTALLQLNTLETAVFQTNSIITVLHDTNWSNTVTKRVSLQGFTALSQVGVEQIARCMRRATILVHDMPHIRAYPCNVLVY